MTAISVVTAGADPRLLDRSFDSLRRQTLAEWQWAVATDDSWQAPADARVRRVAAAGAETVGAARRAACEQCSTEIVVELEPGDELASNALARIAEEFDGHPQAAAVYTDVAQLDLSLVVAGTAWDPSNGWEYAQQTVDGRSVTRRRAFAPTPHNVSYAWWAPLHGHAFRRGLYERVGGYDGARRVLESQDLLSRLFQVGEFVHLPETLYLEHTHPLSPRGPLAPQLGDEPAMTLYHQHLEGNLLAWAARRGLLALDMGAAHRKPPGYLGVDRYEGSAVDIVADVTQGLDLEDCSVGVIRAVDFMEHIPDKVALWNELHRLLAHGAMLLSLTPSSDGRGAFQDPTHVAYYNQNSLWYFTQRAYADFVPQITCRFQISWYATYFMSEWHQANDIPYLGANLVALKDGPRQGGVVLI